MDGPQRDSKPNDKWYIEFDEEGEVCYELVDRYRPGMGESFTLTGTFNDWDHDILEDDLLVEGLYACSIVLGSKGEETFQVVADRDEDMTFHPDIAKCTSKSFPVKGPDKVDKEKAWCIKGDPGSQYRVEFFKSDFSISVSWIKEAISRATMKPDEIADGDAE